MSLKFERAVILGATGPTGLHLTRELTGRVPRLRVISRSLQHLKRVFPGESFERIAADALDENETARALDGCDLVFDCIGLPGDLIHQHPVTARNVARSLSQTKARCVHVSSFWAYLPIVELPLSEDHPREDGPPWVRHRREAEDILRTAGASVLNLPDFYGPHVHTSTLQNALTDAVRGRAMNWIGSPDVEREYIYVPDAMRIAAEIAHHEEAYGKRFILPGSGPLSGRKLADIAGGVLGRSVKLRSAGPTLLRILSWFNKDVRAFMQMVPHYVKPISYDASSLRNLLGDVQATSYEDGIRDTLEHVGSSG